MSLLKKKLHKNIKRKAQKRYEYEKSRERRRAHLKRESNRRGESNKAMLQEMIRQQMIAQYKDDQKGKQKPSAAPAKEVVRTPNRSGGQDGG